jgi:hypothetical protein
MMGRISEAELAFLQDVLEEEDPDDGNYWMHSTTVDPLESLGAPRHLVAVLRRAVRHRPDEIDILYQREGEERRQSARARCARADAAAATR